MSRGRRSTPAGAARRSASPLVARSTGGEGAPTRRDRRPRSRTAARGAVGALALTVAAWQLRPGPRPAPLAGAPDACGSVDGAKLAASFVAILGDPTLHADIVQQATATADQAGDPLDFRVTMSGVLALPDVDLALVVEAEGQSTRFRVIVVGDRRSPTSARDGSRHRPAPWTRASSPGRSSSSRIPNDLEYLGAPQTDGRTLYHLATTGPLPYTPAGFAGSDRGRAR